MWQINDNRGSEKSVENYKISLLQHSRKKHYTSTGKQKLELSKKKKQLHIHSGSLKQANTKSQSKMIMFFSYTQR
jgi:hypothetical protein